MTQLRPIIPEIHKLSAELIIIGNGNQFFAQGFIEEHNLTTPVYIDPELKAYKAAGLLRSVWHTIGPSALKNHFRAFKGGYRQTGVKGDAWQEGGVFIISPQNNLLYSYRSKAAGDHPHPEDILKVLRSK